MKNILRSTQALVLLALIVGCSGIPEQPKLQSQIAAAVETAVAETPTVVPPTLGPFPRSDLVPTSLAVMAGDGVVLATLDSVPIAEVLQGVTMRVSAYIHIDNTRAEGGEETFDRSNVEVRFWGELTKAPDEAETLSLDICHEYGIPCLSPGSPGGADPNAETHFEQVIEFRDELPEVDMNSGGVSEGLRDLGLLAEDAYKIAPDFDAEEWPSDLVVAEYGADDLIDANPTYANSILHEQLPRIRYLNAGGAHGINNHRMPRDQYALNYATVIDGEPVMLPWIVYTFEVNTNALQDGFWRLGIEVDHNDEIEEDNELNNTLTSEFAIFKPVSDWQPAHDTWWEDQWHEVVCDPWEGTPVEASVSDGFDLMLIRVRYYKSSGFAEAPHMPFWADRNTPLSVRQDMYITEFWGPRGTGRYHMDGHWREFYDSDNPRPAADEIKNVFLFLVGNGGCGEKSIATGQDTYDCNFYGPSYINEYAKRFQIMVESWPGQLALLWPNYDHLYTPYNSLMAMAFQHEGQAGTLEPVQRKIAEGFVDYLEDRTSGFSKVTNVWIGGNSRGGAIAMHLAKIIQHRITEGVINPEDNMQIIVTAADGVSVYDRDNLAYKGKVYIRFEDGFDRDASGHNLEEAFPYSSDPDRDFTRNLHIRQACGKSTGMDTMVHGSRSKNWQDFVILDGLTGGFYSQSMTGTAREISHIDMCRVWMDVNAISNIEFFFENALDFENASGDEVPPWDDSFRAYPAGCNTQEMRR